MSGNWYQLTDSPCDLLIVIANANQTGNWCLERWEPIASTGGDKVIHGIKCVLPSCCPPMRQTSSTCNATFVSIALAPLQSLFAGSRLCKIMIGHPTLRFSSDRGSPDALIELRYSEE